MKINIDDVYRTLASKEKDIIEAYIDGIDKDLRIKIKTLQKHYKNITNIKYL